MLFSTCNLNFENINNKLLILIILVSIFFILHLIFEICKRLYSLKRKNKYDGEDSLFLEKSQLLINMYEGQFDIEKFDSFYEENKNMLLNFKPKEHPLDKKSFKKWMKNHKEDNNLYQLSKIFYENSRYISYSEFINKLKNIADNLISKLIENNYTDILFVINSETKKSNFWIGMLFYGMIKNRIKIKYIDIDFIDNFLYSKKFYEDSIKNDPKFKFAYIYCDDATYSGKQLSEFISELAYCGDLFLVLPYYTKKAIMKISNKFYDYINSKDEIKKVNIYFPEKSECMKSFKEIIVGKNNSKLLDTFIKNQIPDKYMFYFSHKLPDEVSIYQSIYALGCNLSGKNKKRYSSLIKNSNYNNIEFEEKYNENICSNRKIYKDLADIIKKGEICPYPFYKNFIYMFNKNKIDSIIQLMRTDKFKIKLRMNNKKRFIEKAKEEGFDEDEIKNILNKIRLDDLTIDISYIEELFEIACDEVKFQKSKKLKKEY